MTAPDARQSDELRELIAETLRNLRDRDAVGYHGRSPGQVADAILPVVTAWAEKRERERAAEAWDEAANELQLSGHSATHWAVVGFRRRAAALAADDRMDPA